MAKGESKANADKTKEKAKDKPAVVKDKVKGKPEEKRAAMATGLVEKSPLVPRLKTHYFERVVPEVMAARNLSNPLQVPRFQKIVVNIGVSEARDNIQALDSAREDLALITGQLPETRRAKKSISNFKLREGMPIGLRVTLRGDRMYEFFDRLMSTAVPRIRDFRGLEPRGFDGRGNFNLGLKEHLIFSELAVEKATKAWGMNITFVTSAATDEEGLDLLQRMGVPFKKREEKKG